MNKLLKSFLKRFFYHFELSKNFSDLDFIFLEESDKPTIGAIWCDGWVGGLIWLMDAKLRRRVETKEESRMSAVNGAEAKRCQSGCHP